MSQVKRTRFPGGSGSQRETTSKYIFAPQRNTKSHLDKLSTHSQHIQKRRLALRFCPQQPLTVHGIYLNISKHNLIK